jgi:rod shape-determining protein MreB
MLQYFKPILYVRLDPAQLRIRDVGSGRELAGPPVAAISREPKRRLVAVGKAADAARTSQPVDVVNPFAHPRSLLSDFTVAEQVLKGFVKSIFSNRIFAPSPVIVIHPKVNPEGGFTQIEIRALHELAIGAGARQAIVWEGRDLRDDELRKLTFSEGGRVLN